MATARRYRAIAQRIFKIKHNLKKMIFLLLFCLFFPIFSVENQSSDIRVVFYDACSRINQFVEYGKESCITDFDKDINAVLSLLQSDQINILSTKDLEYLEKMLNRNAVNKLENMAYMAKLLNDFELEGSPIRDSLIEMDQSISRWYTQHSDDVKRYKESYDALVKLEQQSVNLCRNLVQDLRKNLPKLGASVLSRKSSAHHARVIWNTYELRIETLTQKRKELKEGNYKSALSQYTYNIKEGGLDSWNNSKMLDFDSKDIHSYHPPVSAKTIQELCFYQKKYEHSLIAVKKLQSEIKHILRGPQLNFLYAYCRAKTEKNNPLSALKKQAPWDVISYIASYLPGKP